ncbi:MAG: tRNA (mo5U34)-methyltransferase [Solirubrobacteraceae bacterium]|jgi:tRNA (mo5U34)-methyltransferase|nr:tRNA (mo5U34)-methyltransferase [Solirubrobacteraceae bacterium]
MTLAQAVADLEWYHTLELAPGIVTPGWMDTRPVAAAVPFGDLTGLRCLDVGTFDGFWAFEMERRGAAEVVAIDILDPEGWDWPYGSTAAVKAEIGRRKALGRGFELARDALGSQVDRRDTSVYDLDPDAHGRFDVVYLGSLLVHLREPIRALERIRSVCAGRLIVVDAVDLLLSKLFPRRPLASLDGRGRPWWWSTNDAALLRMIEVAGFAVVSGPDRVYVPAGAGQPVVSPRPKHLLTPQGRDGLVVALRGAPHAVVAARPH